jgi:hypothetical protein
MLVYVVLCIKDLCVQGIDVIGRYCSIWLKGENTCMIQ